MGEWKMLGVQGIAEICLEIHCLYVVLMKIHQMEGEQMDVSSLWVTLLNEKKRKETPPSGFGPKGQGTLLPPLPCTIQGEGG